MIQHKSIHGLIRSICESLEGKGECDYWWGFILASHYTDDQNTEEDRCCQHTAIQERSRIWDNTTM